MRTIRTFSASALAATLLAVSAIVPSASAACEPSFTQVDSVLDAHRIERALPGAAIAVFDGAGTNYHERFFGTYTASTFVPIASASKAVSAAVIMSLVDDGTLSLNDTVAQYLPQYTGTPSGAITLRQAFSQTSGIYNDDWPCTGDGATTLSACATDILDNAPRVSPPGETFFYGGNSMQVAGRIAEIAYCNRFPANCTGLGSGAIWRRIFVERIRDPLGMGMFYNSATNPRIAGGLFSRMSDYRKFWRMIINRGELDGVRVLSRQAVDEMTRDQTGGARVYYSAAQPDIRYGLGVWRFRPDSLGVAHVLSDPGKFGFHPWFDVDTGIGGIVMLNDPAGAAVDGGRHIALQIEQAVHDRFLGVGIDTDADGICDAADLCPAVADPAQLDTDADGAGDACDCAVDNSRLWNAAGETGRVLFYPKTSCLTVSYQPATGQINCFSTRNLLDWFQPDVPGAVATDLRYDVVRSETLADFVGGGVCEATSIERNGPFNNAYVIPAPPAGQAFGYLARASNACGAGPAGRASSGAIIEARECP